MAPQGPAPTAAIISWAQGNRQISYDEDSTAKSELELEGSSQDL